MKTPASPLIPAANGLDLHPATLLSPEPASAPDLDHAANARIIEGRCTIPYGNWPITIVNRDKKPERVIQRLNKPVAERLVAAWTSLRGRVAALVGNGAVYLGHPDYRPAGAANSAANDESAWKRYGKILNLIAGDDALVIETDLTDEAKALCAANAAIAPSPHWGLARTQEKDAAGLSICEPAVLWTLGLVTRPNIAGAAVNSADANAAIGAATEPPPAGPAASPSLAEIAAANERALATIAAELADAQNQLDAAYRDRDARSAEIVAKDKTIADLTAQAATLHAQIEGLRAEMKSAIDRSLAEASAAADARIAEANTATVEAVLDCAANGGLILPADRDHWRGKLAANIAVLAELIAPTRGLKSARTVQSARVAAANAAAGGVSASQRFESIVRERMTSTGEPWEVAWNHCKSTHADIYNLMPNGGRA
jgi:hypothetical protein